MKMTFVMLDLDLWALAVFIDGFGDVIGVMMIVFWDFV